MAKSTHKGHCQACGRLQMLPSGVLAKHGYTVRQGFFSGVCPGSGEFAFEQSCELVAKFAQNARAQLKNLLAFQKTLRKPTEDTAAWFYVSKASPRGQHYGYDRSWERCEITEERVTFENGTPEGGHYSKFSRPGDTHWVSKWSEPVDGAKPYRVYSIEPRTREVSAGYGDSLAQVASKANRGYADWLEAEADSLRRYIGYQEQRVRTWTVQPLLPVERKDKEGFEPTAARY